MRYCTIKAAKAAGVTPNQLGLWKHRDIISVKSEAGGKAQTYTENDVVQIAVCRVLTDLGMDPRHKSALCNQVAYGLHCIGDELRLLHFITFRDGCAVRFNDMALTPDRPALSVVSVDVAAVRKDVRAKLNTVSA